MFEDVAFDMYMYMYMYMCVCIYIYIYIYVFPGAVHADGTIRGEVIQDGDSTSFLTLNS